MDTVLTAAQEFSHLILSAKPGTIIIPSQSMSRPKHREFTELAQDQPADAQKWQSEPQALLT